MITGINESKTLIKHVSYRCRGKNLIQIRNGRTISRNGARRCSVEKIFLKVSQNSQENTCVKVSF